MAFLDRQGAGKYISSIYKIAEDALTKANNPSVNAAVLTSKLNNTKSKLSKGTLAPSEAAVVNDIDKALAHVQNGQIPVENLWGISCSLILALRHPRTLDVGEIIEIDAPERLCPQIFMRADGRRLELCVLGLERPADERGETLDLSCWRAPVPDVRCGPRSSRRGRTSSSRWNSDPAGAPHPSLPASRRSSP